MDSKIEQAIIDAYVQTRSIPETAFLAGVSEEMVEELLADPNLLTKLMARRRGELTVEFVSDVIPQMMRTAASKDKGAVTAAKLVADVLGLATKRPPGRPRNPKSETASQDSIEAALRKLNDAE